MNDSLFWSHSSAYVPIQRSAPLNGRGTDSKLCYAKHKEKSGDLMYRFS